MICCSCGKEIDINYGREYWNGIYCKKCADEMLSTPEGTKKYAKIIADLQAENAALKERLEKALELPCMAKLEIVDDNDKHLKYIYFIFYKENGKFSSIKYLNKKAAEARLKELKGEQNG